MTVNAQVSIWQADTFGEVLVNQTVGELLAVQAEQYAGQDAVVYQDTQAGVALRWRYEQLKARVDAVARGLMAAGVGRGDKVAVLAPNVPEWLLLELAIGTIGAVLVTVNTNSRRTELDYVLRKADVHTLVLASHWRNNDYVACIQGLVPELASPRAAFEPLQTASYPALQHVVLLDGATPGLPTLAMLETLGSRVSPDTLAQRCAAVLPSDVFQIQFTSGTTGNPKGATITHHAAINNARFFAARAGLQAADRLVSAMPLFHTAGNVMEVFGVLANGATLVKAISFEPMQLLALIHHERATVLSAVPTMVIAMLERYEENPGTFDTSSLRLLISGGTPIPVPVLEKVKRVFGADPVIGFGMTETSPMVTGTLSEDSFELKSSTVGIPLPYTEVKIVGDDGQPVPLGASGELLIRGYLVTQGYYRDEDRTAESIDEDGWFRSGDLASMDRQGYVRIVGRIKDMVIRGGENVYPAEVETFLMRHPLIKQAHVVGVPDPYMGEETVAFVQLQEAAALSEAELLAHCKAQMARHKVPKHYRFVQDFPLTPSGKVKKFELRDTFVAEGQAQQAVTHGA